MSYTLCFVVRASNIEGARRPSLQDANHPSYAFPGGVSGDRGPVAEESLSLLGDLPSPCGSWLRPRLCSRTGVCRLLLARHLRNQAFNNMAIATVTSMCDGLGSKLIQSRAVMLRFASLAPWTSARQRRVVSSLSSSRFLLKTTCNFSTPAARSTRRCCSMADFRMGARQMCRAFRLSFRLNSGGRLCSGRMRSMMRLWRREVSKGRSSDFVASPWSSVSESIRARVKDDGPGARVYSWVAAIVS